MNNLPEIKPVALQTPSAESNLQDKSSPEKSEFASLVERECSKSADCKSNQKEIHSESAMKEDDGPNGDMPACSDCTNDINDTKHNFRGDNDLQKTNDIESVNSDDENSDNENDPGKGLKTGALLFSLVQNYIADITNGSQVSTGDGATESADIGEGGPESELKSENGLKVGALLNNLIADYAAEIEGGLNHVSEGDHNTGLNGDGASDLPAGNGLKVGTLLNNPATNYAAETEGGLNHASAGDQGPGLNNDETSDLSAGNGLKVGTLLNNLATNYAAETGKVLNIVTESDKNAGLNGDELSNLPAGNGLKVGKVLNDLVSSYAAEIEDVAESGGSVSESNGEKGLKIGELLSRVSDRSDEKGINNELIKEENASAEKTIDISTEADDFEADSVIFRKEITAQSEMRNEVPRHTEKNHADGKTAVMDMPKANDNSDGLNSRLMSGSSDQFKQENGTGDHTFNFAKGPHNSGNDAEGNNINSINTSNTAIENAKSVQNPSALHTAKTPGVQELLDNVIYVIKGNSKMGVSVEHENLGKLNINLSLEKGMVNVHINASDQAVREIIENNIQHIIDSLNKDGVSVGEFSVGLREQREHELNRTTLKNGQDRGIPQETKKDHRHRGLVNIFA